MPLNHKTACPFLSRLLSISEAFTHFFHMCVCVRALQKVMDPARAHQSTMIDEAVMAAAAVSTFIKKWLCSFTT